MDSGGTRTPPVIVQATMFFIVGILVAENQHLHWLWLGFLIPVLFSLRFLLGIGTVPVYVFGLFGFSWGSWHLHEIRTDDSIIQTGYETGPTLFRLIGRVTDIDPDPSWGSKSLFTPIRLLDSTGNRMSVRGRLSWRVEGGHHLCDGDLVHLVGWIFPPGGTGSAADGNGVDWTSMARFSGYRGRLVVPDPRLVHRLPEDGLSGMIPSLRGALRSRFAEIVSRGVSAYRERTLLLGMTIGIRGPSWNRVSAPFRRTGVAHVLAISGMHLGIVIGFVFFICRVSGASGPVIALSTIITTLLYLTIVSWRPPIVRSAIMAITLSLGACRGRFPKSTSLLFLAAMVILLHNPGSLFLPGFQLSFVVVLFILTGTRSVQRRWFRRTGPTAGIGVRSCAVASIQTTLVVSVVAWLASIPIIVHHFGTISPFAVPLSIILVPFLTTILGLSCLKITLSVFGLEDLVSPELMMFPTRCVITIVDWFDSLPMSCIAIEHSSWIVVPTGLSAVAVWTVFGLRESCWKITPLLVRRSGRSGRTERGLPDHD